MIRQKLKFILKKTRIFFLIFISVVTYSIAIFVILNGIFPFALPFSGKDFAITIIAGDGSPLRSFPDKNGVWRYPVKPGNVSPLYIQALINYEDRFFRYHPGVNPAALLRAAFQRVKYGKFVSGGSTLTMQVARILKPHKKTVKLPAGK
jgi:penicillin-binding protein 1C